MTIGIVEVACLSGASMTPDETMTSTRCPTSSAAAAR